DLASLSMSNANVIYKNLLDSFVAGLVRDDDILFAAVVDASDNRILAHSDHSRDGLLFVPQDFESDVLAKRLSVPRNSIKVFISTLLIHGHRYGDLVVGYTSAAVVREVESFRAKALTVTGLAMILGLVLAVALARFLSSPVRGMAVQARRIGAGDYDQKVDYDSRDALGELADAFNEMIANLKDRQTQLETINNIAARLHQSRHRGEVIGQAVEILAEYTGAPSISVYILEEGAGRLRMIEDHGFSMETLEKSADLPVEGSLSGLAVRTRDIVISRDIYSDERLEPGVRAGLLKDGFTSVVSIPLLSRDAVLGVVNLIFKTTQDISQEQCKTFLSVGRTLALALDNADYVDRIEKEIGERQRAEEALKHSIQEITALNNLAREAGRYLALDKVAEAAIRHLSGILAPELITISLLEDGALAVQGFFTANELELDDNRVAVEGLCRRGLENGGPYYSRNVRGDGSGREGGLASFAVLPLFIGDDIIGVLGLGSKEERDFRLESAFLEALAGQLAVALMNARQYEQIKRQAAELEVRVAERTAELEIAMEKAMDADRIKSAFLASMSHELRTPLNSIIGFTGILLQKLPGPLNEEQSKQLGMVQNSARHLLDLINDVLDISKIEAGQLELSDDTFRFDESLRKVLDLVGPLAEQKGLALTSRMDPAIGDIRTDRRRLEQILINLINNAIKFTDQGWVRVDSRIEKGRLVTRVSDTGIGLKPDEVQTLFKAFRQLDSGLARRYEGTGLGLSICKKLVELMGGRIRAESPGPEKGSVFTVDLPLDV
ncbi:MAG: GAF domain-containing protein, partial [Proteobacteria bacterium]|nr:GAF domain-containing protein [Pseudomonadota bacterium]